MGKSNQEWQNRQNRDPYVKRALKEGWRSRAVFKLEEINNKEKILYPGMTCMDLGSSPGSWSQYTSLKLKEKVEIIALDILPMDYLPAVEFVQGDFSDDEFFNSILLLLKNRKIDLVMSDMAPNISGIKISDQARSMHLVELALDIAKKILKKRGNFICKLFQGYGSEIFIKEVRQEFEKVKVFKPKSSRPDSREVYLIAKSYLG
jgi:23S rRNA (uridine2552-2'-O)-methyltransferase